MFQIECRRAVKTSQFVVKPTAPPPDTSKKTEAPVDADIASEAMFRAEAERDMDEEEELFNVEESLPNPETYSWEDKYRPRKPRYLNKVHTGYEWNKYNQTHYEYAFLPHPSCMARLTEPFLVLIILLPKSCRDTSSIYSTPISSRVQRLRHMSRSKNLATTRQWCFSLPLGHLTRISLSGSSIGTGSFHTRSKQPLLPQISSSQRAILGVSSVPLIVDAFLFGSTSVAM